jgi:hypothetical protein
MTALGPELQAKAQRATPVARMALNAVIRFEPKARIRRFCTQSPTFAVSRGNGPSHIAGMLLLIPSAANAIISEATFGGWPTCHERLL